MRIETKGIKRNLKEELIKFWKTENVGTGATMFVYEDFESTINLTVADMLHLFLLNRISNFYPTVTVLLNIDYIIYRNYKITILI